MPIYPIHMIHLEIVGTCKLICSFFLSHYSKKLIEVSASLHIAMGCSNTLTAKVLYPTAQQLPWKQKPRVMSQWA